MNPLVTSETRKLTTLRMPWIVLGVATLGSAALGGANVHLMRDGQAVDLSTVARSVAEPVWFLVTVVAILAASAEFQHRTVRTTLLAAPRRGAVLAAKAVVAAGYGVLAVAAAVLGSVAAGLLVGHAEGVQVHAGTVTDWLGVLAAVLIGGLWGVLASGLGLLTRSSAIALTTLLLWKFVLEGALPVLLRRPAMAHWTPSGVASTLAHPTGPPATVLVSGLVLAAYVALVSGAAAWSFVSRDPA
ncbi:MAG: hypothetical protein ACXV3C_05010 [Actinomycetes bacterium]